MGRDWGSPEIPEKIDLKTMIRLAPQVITKPRWMREFGRVGHIPDLTAPNLAPPGGKAPTFFGAYYEWMTTPPPTWEDVEWMRKEWGGPFMLKGVCRVDDAKRAVDAGVTAISVSNHGGNNLDGTPAAIRDAQADRRRRRRPGRGRHGRRRPARLATSSRPLALGARAVMIGRAYLWGLAVNGQAGVENVLDILRGGIDSAHARAGAVVDRRAHPGPPRDPGRLPPRPRRLRTARSRGRVAHPPRGRTPGGVIAPRPAGAAAPRRVRRRGRGASARRRGLARAVRRCCLQAAHRSGA